MKARPILFNAPMVRALLDGTKTQTRRLVKPQPTYPRVGGACSYDEHGEWVWLDGNDGSIVSRMGRCPYGQPGDRLWVRETWAYGIHALAAARDEDGPFVYAADSHSTQGRLCDRWRPSIHMPRAASRITLEVTEVRVERLQDISYEDALAEGSADFRGAIAGECTDETPDECARRLRWPQRWYSKLWDGINGNGAWDANPWVWAVSFKRLPA